MAILATGVIAPALQEAYAVKADKMTKLSPKAFGDKTKYKMITDNTQKIQKSGFELVKKEEAKSFKKITADYKAKKLLQQLYRIG